jgi:hypothetical protein
MDDKKGDFRAAAGECLNAARSTSDESARATFLLMAQKWLERSREHFRRCCFDALLDDFNDQQMRPSGPPGEAPAQGRNRDRATMSCSPGSTALSERTQQSSNPLPDGPISTRSMTRKLGLAKADPVPPPATASTA